MYKKKQFESVAENYSTYQDSGSVGLMMDICHKGLEKINYLKNLDDNSIILEIGAGSSPHIKYVNHNYKKYFFLESSSYAINFLKKKFSKNKKISIKFYKNKNIPFKKKD